MPEVVYDYLEINPTTFVALEENQAYVKGNRVALSFDLHGNEAYAVMN